MTLILPDRWEKTAAEKKGYVRSQKGILEGGYDCSAHMLRKDQAPELTHQLLKTLWAIRNKMAELGWDDDSCHVAIGIQVRNGWAEVDGTWYEKGSEEWLKAVSRKG